MASMSREEAAALPTGADEIKSLGSFEAVLARFERLNAAIPPFELLED